MPTDPKKIRAVEIMDFCSGQFSFFTGIFVQKIHSSPHNFHSRGFVNTELWLTQGKIRHVVNVSQGYKHRVKTIRQIKTSKLKNKYCKLRQLKHSQKPSQKEMEAPIAKAPFVLKCNFGFNLNLHMCSVRLRKLNGLMWEDGQDRVDLCWEPKGK